MPDPKPIPTDPRKDEEVNPEDVVIPEAPEEEGDEPQPDEEGK